MRIIMNLPALSTLISPVLCSPEIVLATVLRSCPVMSESLDREVINDPRGIFLPCHRPSFQFASSRRLMNIHAVNESSCHSQSWIFRSMTMNPFPGILNLLSSASKEVRTADHPDLFHQPPLLRSFPSTDRLQTSACLQCCG